MSASSFGSYEGPGPYEYGPGTAHAPSAEQAAAWSWPVDELGNPVPPPPPPGAAPRAGQAGPAYADPRYQGYPPVATAYPAPPPPAGAGWQQTTDITALDVATALVPLPEPSPTYPAPAEGPGSYDYGAPYGTGQRQAAPWAEQHGYDQPWQEAPRPAADGFGVESYDPGLDPEAQGYGSQPYYGALPAVSLPTGAIAPASVALPLDTHGPSLPAVDAGPIVVGSSGHLDASAPMDAAQQAGPLPVVANGGADGGIAVGAVNGHYPAAAAFGQSQAQAPYDDLSPVVDLGERRAAAPAGARHGVDPGPVVVVDGDVHVGPDPAAAWHAQATATALLAPPVPEAIPAGPAPVVPPVAMTPGMLASVMVDLASTAATAAAALGANGADPGVAVGAPPEDQEPLPPYHSPRRPTPEDFATRYAMVREQVDYAMAEIALARAAFRRACAEEGPGWPFRDSELEMLRRPAVAHALAWELAGVERLRLWAQELHWLQEQNRPF